MSYDDALAQVGQLRQRLSILERMAADPSATPDTLRRGDLIAAAEKAGFLNPELAARVLAADDGEPADLVARLGAEFPYMRKPDMNELMRSGRAGRTGRKIAPADPPEEAATDMNTVLRSATGKPLPDQRE